MEAEASRLFGQRKNEALAALEPYADREVHRVHLACLRLSKGDLSQLRHYVQQAVMDYRDVLYWAEYYDR